MFGSGAAVADLPLTTHPTLAGLLLSGKLLPHRYDFLPENSQAVRVRFKDAEQARHIRLGFEGPEQSGLLHRFERESVLVMKPESALEAVVFSTTKPERYGLEIPEVIVDSLAESGLMAEALDERYAFKALFMAGGPGAGKSDVSAEMFSGLGLVFVNQDTTLDFVLNKVGIKSRDFADPKVQAEISPFRPGAKALMMKRQELLMRAHVGMVIDGTGRDVPTVTDVADVLRQNGYDVGMVFINTSLEAAIARVQLRDRTVPLYVISDSWHEVQQNLGAYQRYFGPENFLVVDNEKKMTPEQFKTWGNMILRRMGLKWLNRPLENTRAREIAGRQLGLGSLTSSERDAALRQFGLKRLLGESEILHEDLSDFIFDKVHAGEKPLLSAVVQKGQSDYDMTHDEAFSVVNRLEHGGYVSREGNALVAGPKWKSVPMRESVQQLDELNITPASVLAPRNGQPQRRTVIGGFRFRVGGRSDKSPYAKDIQRSIQSKRNVKRGAAKRIMAIRKFHRSPQGQRLHRALGRYNSQQARTNEHVEEQMRFTDGSAYCEGRVYVWGLSESGEAHVQPIAPGVNLEAWCKQYPAHGAAYLNESELVISSYNGLLNATQETALCQKLCAESLKVRVYDDAPDYTALSETARLSRALAGSVRIREGLWSVPGGFSVWIPTLSMLRTIQEPASQAFAPRMGESYALSKPLWMQRRSDNDYPLLSRKMIVGTDKGDQFTRMTASAYVSESEEMRYSVQFQPSLKTEHGPVYGLDMPLFEDTEQLKDVADHLRDALRFVDPREFKVNIALEQVPNGTVVQYKLATAEMSADKPVLLSQGSIIFDGGEFTLLVDEQIAPEGKELLSLTGSQEQVVKEFARFAADNMGSAASPVMQERGAFVVRSRSGVLGRFQKRSLAETHVLAMRLANSDKLFSRVFGESKFSLTEADNPQAVGGASIYGLRDPFGENETLDDVLDTVLGILVITKNLPLLQDVEFDDEYGSMILYFDPTSTSDEMIDILRPIQGQYKGTTIVASPDTSLPGETVPAEWWVVFIPGVDDAPIPTFSDGVPVQQSAVQTTAQQQANVATELDPSVSITARLDVLGAIQAASGK